MVLNSCTTFKQATFVVVVVVVVRAYSLKALTVAVELVGFSAWSVLGARCQRSLIVANYNLLVPH